MTSSPEVLCRSVSAWLSSILPPDAEDEGGTKPEPTASSPVPCRWGELRPKRARLSIPRKDDESEALWAPAPFPSPPTTAISAMAPIPPSPRQKRARDECDDDDDGDDENGSASAGGHHSNMQDAVLGLQTSNLDESTPRAERAGHAPLPAPVPLHLVQDASVTSTPTASVSSHAPSLASRTSSPTKQMRFASLDVTGYLIKSFSADGHTAPPSLAQMHLHLTDIQEKVAIIPDYLKHEVVLPSPSPLPARRAVLGETC
ncbi:hypothetical protein ColLi_12179 [Colletotrichum liriopes]|uniref:Uncharacterized protein n=1 Tax=Colletotrichum liriopes TaxID=708192 RepID=A0AA37GXX1_9PEZI|nr:hypothetical protein ColLi_12179 [Colletotrichum liriopes]